MCPSQHSRTSFIPSTESRQKTLNPRPSSCSFRLFCSGLIRFPGALVSTKDTFPSGRSTILSGTPSHPGLTNFGHRPPMLLTASTSFLSMVLSFISGSPSVHKYTRITTVPFIFIRVCVHISVSINLRKTPNEYIRKSCVVSRGCEQHGLFPPVQALSSVDGLTLDLGGTFPSRNLAHHGRNRIAVGRLEFL